MKIKCVSFTFTRHAVAQMFDRKISTSDVKSVIQTGEVIQSYTEDKPYPSFLMLAYMNKRPIHVVIARNQQTGECIIVTAYEPSPSLWDPDFKNRLKDR